MTELARLGCNPGENRQNNALHRIDTRSVQRMRAFVSRVIRWVKGRADYLDFQIRRARSRRKRRDDDRQIYPLW